MECENEFCIYWKKNQCILDEISLDILGCCRNCIYVAIEEETMQRERDKLLQRLQ